MFLTRIGEGSKLAVVGDSLQSDLPKKSLNGLHDLWGRMTCSEEIGRVILTDADIVRHHLIHVIESWYAK